MRRLAESAQSSFEFRGSSQSLARVAIRTDHEMMASTVVHQQAHPLFTLCPFFFLPPGSGEEGRHSFGTSYQDGERMIIADVLPEQDVTAASGTGCNSDVVHEVARRATTSRFIDSQRVLNTQKMPYPQQRLIPRRWLEKNCCLQPSCRSVHTCGYTWGSSRPIPTADPFWTGQEMGELSINQPA